MTVREIATPSGQANAHLHLADQPSGALVLGHGAAGGVGAPDLVAATEAAVSRGVQRRPRRAAIPRRREAFPAAAPRLDAAWTAVIENLVAAELRGLPLVVGGRSIGARVACRTVEATGAVGVVCLAFPLQPPQRRSGAPTPSRLAELDAVTVPVLVVQGERDRFGMPPAGSHRTVVRVAGDHGLKSDLEAVGAAVADWLRTTTTQTARTKTRSSAG